MIRIIGGLVLGVAIFVGILLATEFAAHRIAPTKGSATQLVIVALAYFVSAAAGGALAAVVSRRAWAAWAIALLVTLGAVVTIVTMRQPLWMQIASVVAPLLGGLAAHAFAAKRVAEPALAATADV
jgi:hypothetical protein